MKTEGDAILFVTVNRERLASASAQAFFQYLLRRRKPGLTEAASTFINA
jgi:hypothetical protein